MENQQLASARSSLQLMQNFDVSQLTREAELGQQLNFGEVVPIAEKIVSLYCLLPPSALDDFGGSELKSLTQVADSCYRNFQLALTFDAKKERANTTREGIIQQIKNEHPKSFTVLHPLIGYSSSKFSGRERLEQEGKDAVQKIQDDAKKIVDELEQQKVENKAERQIVQAEAQDVLTTVRKAAAELGVSQQAKHFKKEANWNGLLAVLWMLMTLLMAISLIGYVVFATIFVYEMPWFQSSGIASDDVQLIISKSLIFAVISFMLYLSAKNFLSRQHNAIVNRHRQNALMTYQTLVEATGDKQTRDIVLMHAASCIYAPQPTGYAPAGDSSAPGGKSVIELLSKQASPGGE